MCSLSVLILCAPRPNSQDVPHIIMHHSCHFHIYVGLDSKADQGGLLVMFERPTYVDFWACNHGWFWPLRTTPAPNLLLDPTWNHTRGSWRVFRRCVDNSFLFQESTNSAHFIIRNFKILSKIIKSSSAFKISELIKFFEI